MIHTTSATAPDKSEASTWAKFVREATAPGSELQGCLGAPTGPELMFLSLKAVQGWKMCAAKHRSSGRGSAGHTVSGIAKRARPCRFKSLTPPSILKEGPELSVHIRLGNGYFHKGESWELMASGTRRKIPVPQADIQLPNKFSALKEDAGLEALYATKHQTSTQYSSK